MRGVQTSNDTFKNYKRSLVNRKGDESSEKTGYEKFQVIKELYVIKLSL